MKTINHSKKAAIAIILSLLILLPLIWIFYQQRETESNVDKSVGDKALGVDANQDDSQSDEEKSRKGVDISEWGMKSGYTQSDVKLIYMVSDSSDAIMLSEEDLLRPDETGNSCGYGDLGEILRYASDDQLSRAHFATGDETITAEQYFENSQSEDISWKKIGSYYYYFSSPQALCSTKDDLKQENAIKAGIELTNNIELKD